MERTVTITVYLLKERVGTPSDALKPDLEPRYTTHELTTATTTGTIFVAEQEDRLPSWVELLQPVTQPPVRDRTRSTRALLVLRAAERWFAIAFGHGRTMLDPAIYVRRFGLRVSLNATDPARLRGAQARSFNGYALHTLRQVSRVSSVDALELDVERDLVTSMAGEVLDPSLGRRVDGQDAVHLTARLDVSELAAKCAKLLAESEKQTYRRHYPWIDKFEGVTDPSAIAHYAEAAATDLGQRRFDRFDVYPPELVGPEITQFRIYPGNGGLAVVEPSAALLRYAIPQVTGPADAQAAAQRYKLIGIDGNGHEVGRWPFWDCLHYEAQHTDRTIVLDGGQWYVVDRDFATGVDHFAASLRSSGLVWPPAVRGEREDAYNARVANVRQLALLDKRLIRLVGQSPIEPCDLFGRRGQLIHVKRAKGGSAPLSHLWGQASVSAECLVSELAFRREMRKRIARSEEAHLSQRIGEPLVARDHPIVLALITTAASASQPATALPFFSKVLLRQTVRRLRQMSLRVHIDGIATVPPARPGGRAP